MGGGGCRGWRRVEWVEEGVVGRAGCRGPKGRLYWWRCRCRR